MHSKLERSKIGVYQIFGCPFGRQAMHVTSLCYITISKRAGQWRRRRAPAPGSLARRPRAATLGSRVSRTGLHATAFHCTSSCCRSHAPSPRLGCAAHKTAATMHLFQRLTGVVQSFIMTANILLIKLRCLLFTIK